MRSELTNQNKRPATLRVQQFCLSRKPIRQIIHAIDCRRLFVFFLASAGLIGMLLASSQFPTKAWRPAGVEQPGHPTRPTFTNLLGKQTVAFDSAIIQFSAVSFVANEADGKATITITRTGSTSDPVSVRYSISDGTAKQRSDYILAFGTLSMAASQTTKSFEVLIVDDAYIEGNESFSVTLSDPVGATIGTPNSATVTIADNDTGSPTSNPIDQTRFFVQLHYYDFLSRYPDTAGWDFWSNNLNSCSPQPTCIEVQRINTSASFFLSIEFQNTGYLVERMYKAAFGDATGTSTFNGSHQLPVPAIRFAEFISDTHQISDGVVVLQTGWEQLLESNKQAFAAEFAQRPRFTTAFPTALTPAQFVDQLNTNVGNVLSPTERATAIGLFAGAANSSNTTARGQALRQVSEDQDLYNSEFNRAFVLMQYFGFLRRNPNDPQDTDYTGYDFWLTKLNQFGGNYINAEMIKAFITSLEYRARFAPAGGAPTPTPTPTPGQGLTAEQRVAALERVRAKIESLSATGANKNDVNQQLFDFIRTLPEFAEAGISNDSCVWARYTDGVWLVVTNNLDPPAPSNAVSKRAVAAPVRPNVQPENLPHSIKARLLWALGPVFDTGNPVSDIRAWLNEENYTEPINEGATVEALKTVGGDGVLFLAGHGGPENGPEPFSVSTATLVSVAKDKELETDLKPPARLVHSVGIYDRTLTGSGIYGATYGITSQFVRDYWTDFSPNSFVYIFGCNGSSVNALPFRMAMKDKGASVYAGWTRSVHGGGLFGAPAENTARFVFDRLLGGNHVYPESDGFKQRPFDYKSVANDFQYHGVGKDPEDGAELVFTPLSDPSADGFQLLAPSIMEMNVAEKLNVGEVSTLVITGIFGEDPGPNSRAVFVGGKEVHVQDWSPTDIACDLPESGPGSAGEVIVTVHQQKSNTAYLSEWQGTFTHTVEGDGTLKQTSTYNVRWRADIRKVRYEIHKPPTIEALRAFLATDDSTLAYACGGKATFGENTEEWSGSGTIPRIILPAPAGGFLTGGFFSDDRKLSLVLSVNYDGLIRTLTSPGNPPVVDYLQLFSPRVVPSADGAISVDLDANGNIIGNTLTRTVPVDGVHTLTWSLIQIRYPPSPDSPR